MRSENVVKRVCGSEAVGEPLKALRKPILGLVTLPVGRGPEIQTQLDTHARRRYGRVVTSPRSER